MGRERNAKSEKTGGGWDSLSRSLGGQGKCPCHGIFGRYRGMVWRGLFSCSPTDHTLCRASPRLKDAQIEASEYPVLYQELMLNIRRMFHQCKLVHADLSEYNILYHNSHLYIIDVSQSVEHDHPSAFDFLRNDMKNVEDFFGRFGVKCLGLRRSFEFVTKEDIGETGQEDGIVLKEWLEQEVQPDDTSNDTEAASNQAAAVSAHEDSIFMQSYIPRTLNEVYDPERDVEALQNDRGRGLIYADTIGLVDPSKKSDSTTKVHFKDNEEEDAQGSDASESEDDQDKEDSDEGEDTIGKTTYEERTPRGHRHEDREAKKVCSSVHKKNRDRSLTACFQERKKAVKEDAREKRKHKIPKADKKRKIKNTRS